MASRPGSARGCRGPQSDIVRQYHGNYLMIANTRKREVTGNIPERSTYTCQPVRLCNRLQGYTAGLSIDTA